MAAVLVLSCTAAFAQSGAGAIQGTVKDSSGAVLPNASVRVINKGTGQVSNAKTNSVGFYSVPGLFAGDYTVAVTAQGLAEYDTNISLQVAQTAVLSPTLSVGSVAQEVTVSGGIQLATYDSGTISSQLDNARINQLPMNGRNILTLTGQTTPGLEANGTRANGNMAAALEYVQDGAPLADRNFGGATIQPDPDSVQEVKIETTNSNAKFTTPATAIVTTKSGTNSLHGSFFETARNNAIGIAKSRTDPYNLKAPHLVRNEFGASLGGPIVLPKIYNGKDKSFFFFAYERYSLRQGVNQRLSVPTDAMRGGDFGALLSIPTPVTLYNNNTTAPVTYQRQPYANNVVTAPISPLAKAVYAVSPHATTQDNPYVQGNYIGPAVNNTTTPTVTFRLDHIFNDNNRAYLRYTSANSQTVFLRGLSGVLPDTIAASGIPAGMMNRSLTPTSVYSGALGFTHIFSPTFVSETILSNEWESSATGTAANKTLNFESLFGLPNNFGQAGVPYLSGMSMLNYNGTQYNYAESQIITNLDENLTKTLGRHQLFFGGRYRHERLGALPDRTQDQVDFNSGATAVNNTASGANYSALPHTGDPNADFYLGAAHLYVQRLNAPYQHWRDQEFDAYIQDDYHVTDKLTLNLGLRWEAHPAATVKNNLFSSFDFKNKAIVLGAPVQKFIDLGYTTQTIVQNLQNLGTSFETPQQAGLPNNMINSSNAIFAPRVGFAYAPFGSGRGMVFRAGYGRYVYPIPIRNFYASSKLNAPYASTYTQDYNSASQSPDGLPNYFLRSNGTPIVAGVNSSNVVNSGNINSLKPGDPSEFVLNPHYPPNIVTQLNATIEQPLPGSSVLRVSYLWDHGENLDQENHLNNPMSTYVWEVKTGTTPPTGTYSKTALNAYDQTTFGGSGLVRQDRNGWSNDNALQVNYQRLYKHGYAYQVFYVYSRAMRVGGNAFRDGVLYPTADYAPGMAPTSDPHGLNVFQNYGIDTAIPEHRINFNGIVDLPIGRGKRYFGGVNRFWNELIGGYQIAGSGSILSEYFGVSSSNWGPTNRLKVYNKKYKIQDCSSGVCHPGYLWFNGFINPLSLNNPCGPSLYSGIPASNLPYQTPINMDPGTVTCVGSGGTTPKASNPNYLTNIVQVPLNNGSMSPVAYSPGPGLNPFSKTVLHGPYNWTADMSVFKVFPITEKVLFRVNMDAFNVFNVQGYNNPSGSTGIQNFLSSHNTPRQIQLTARLTF